MAESLIANILCIGSASWVVRDYAAIAFFEARAPEADCNRWEIIMLELSETIMEINELRKIISNYPERICAPGKGPKGFERTQMSGKLGCIARPRPGHFHLQASEICRQIFRTTSHCTCRTFARKESIVRWLFLLLGEKVRMRASFPNPQILIPVDVFIHLHAGDFTLVQKGQKTYGRFFDTIFFEGSEVMLIPRRQCLATQKILKNRKK